MKRKQISVTYIFDFDRDRARYLNFPEYLSKLGCPDDVIKEFVQTGQAIWHDKDGQIKVTKIAQVVNES
jgi:hypothetical protein